MGAEGGLYPGAKNSPPRAHAGAGRDIVRRIRPLTPSGEYDGDGRYVLLSIGVSNTEAEFSAFEEVAASEPSKDDDLVVVNGSQGGVAAAQWADPSNEAWSTIDDRLAAAGVTPRQVAIAWVKVANRIDPQVPPEPWPAYAQDLQRDMESIARILADRYPNIRVAYYSSRVYGGYADDGPGNPEPFAYEGGFSVKWMIERQILGAPGLNYDPARGSVEAPWLAWGPYLWADGLRRRADGLAWRCSDFQSDGTHPSLSGQEKVAALLLEFLTTDPSAVEWFTSAGGRHRRAS